MQRTQCSTPSVEDCMSNNLGVSIFASRTVSKGALRLYMQTLSSGHTGIMFLLLVSQVLHTQVTEHIGSLSHCHSTPSPGRWVRASLAFDMSHGFPPAFMEHFVRVSAKWMSFPPTVMVISLAALAAGDSLLIWLYTSSVVAPPQAASVKP